MDCSEWANFTVLVIIGSTGIYFSRVNLKYIRWREYNTLVRDYDSLHAAWDQFRLSREGQTGIGPTVEYPVLEQAVSALDSLAHFLLDKKSFLKQAEASLKVKMKTPYERYVNLSKDKQNPTPYTNADDLYQRWHPDDAA